MVVTAAGLKAFMELESKIVELGVAAQMRRPPKFIKHAGPTRAQGRHAGAVCRGCFEIIEPGARITWEEDLHSYIKERRHHYWHPEHHPDRVDREWNRQRNRFIRKGWS